MTEPLDATIGTLLAPRRVAVIGSVTRPDRPGARTVRHLLDARFDGHVQAVSDPGDLDADPFDVAVVAVPAAAVASVLATIGDRADHAIVYSSGFGEVGGSTLEAAPGPGILGPNTVGLYWAPSRAVLTFARAFDDLTDCARGPGVALVSQSGAFGARLVRAARHRGLAVDGFVATGNEDGYRAADVLRAFARLPENRPRVVAAYVENLRDGTAIAEAVAEARAAGIEVVVLLGGRTRAGTAAAQSHTAAVTPDNAIASELLRLHGAAVVTSDRELVDAMIALALAPPAAGRRFAVVTGSGGAGVVAADLLASADVDVEPLDAGVRTEIEALLPSFATAANPVDVTAQAIGDTGLVCEVVSRLAKADGVDGVLTVARGSQAPALHDVGSRFGTPVVTALLDGDDATVGELVSAGVLALGDLEAGVRAAAALARDQLPAAERRRERPSPAAPGDDEVPVDATEGTASGGDVASSLTAVEQAGVAVAPWVLAHSVDEAAAGFRRVGGPVVVKANLPAATHKAAAGGVRLDVGSDDAVRRAVAELLPLAGSVVVARQLRGGPELFAGARLAPSFGLVVSAGLGGGAMELLDRTVTVPAAASTDWLEARMLRTVFGDDDRWRPVATALAEVAARLAALARTTGTALVECNPLIETPSGLVALDARVLRSETR